MEPSLSGILRRSCAPALVLFLVSPVAHAATTLKTEWRAGSVVANLSNVVTAELTGDSIPDIGLCVDGAPVIVSRRGGTYVPVWYGPVVGCRKVAAGDSDGDGVAELYTAPSGQNPAVYAFRYGFLDPVRRVATPEILGIAFGNVDADPAKELVLTSANDLYVYTASTFALEWKATGRGGRGVAIGNVDADADPEIVVNGSIGRVLSAVSRTDEWAYNGGWGPGFILGDLNADGRDEIIYINTGAEFAYYGGPVSALDTLTLANLWTYPGSHVTLGLRDLTGDGLPEVLTGYTQWGSTYALKPDGTLLWSIQNPGHGCPGVAAADIDGDGQIEVVWDSSDGLFIAAYPTKTLEEIVPRAVGNYRGLVADLDADGSEEMVSLSTERRTYDPGVVSFFESGSMAPYSWINLSYGTNHFMRGGQIDGDVAREIVVSSLTRILAFDGISEMPNGDTGVLPSNPVALEVANVDGDAIDEVIVAAGSSVYVFNGVSPYIQWSSEPLPSTVTALAVGDVNGDGAEEILVLAGRVFVIDTATWTVTDFDGGLGRDISFIPPVGGRPGLILVAGVESSVWTGYGDRWLLTGYSPGSYTKRWQCAISEPVTDLTGGVVGSSAVALASSEGGLLRSWLIRSDSTDCPAAQRMAFGTSALGAIDYVSPGRFLISRPSGVSLVTLSLKAIRGDADADAKSDVIVQNTSSGAVATWSMNGTAIRASASSGSAAGLVVAGSGDVDGDTRADLVLRDPASGEIRVWLMNGGTRLADALVGISAGYDVAGVADFDGDGKSDILLRDSLGNIGLWIMNGPSIAAGAFVGSPGNYEVAGAGDFSGDGKADILLRDQLGNLGMWIMDGAAITSGAFVGSPGGYSVASVGDFNGDGRFDILLQDEYGEIGLWLMDGATITAGSYVGSPNGYVVAATGDYNGDGRDDILLFHQATRAAGMWLMDGPAITGGGFVATLAAQDEIR